MLCVSFLGGDPQKKTFWSSASLSRLSRDADGEYIRYVGRA